MLINTGRGIPEKNALNKYAVNLAGLGQTAAEVKEYFDVGVYRNILDMLLTFEGVLNLWKDDLYNNAITLTYANILNFGRDTIISGNKLSGRFSGTNYPQSSIGFAAAAIPGRPAHIVVEEFINKLMRANSMGSLSAAVGPPSLSYADISKAAKKIGYFNVQDLLALARNINWEMNRVRLPIPHNFRQINQKVQGRDYNVAIFTATTRSNGDSLFGGKRKLGGRIYPEQNFINLVTLIPVATQLKQAINSMRVAIRKEIDAANLAKKVQENTIRKEQDSLITRQKADEESTAREIQILAEKKAAYEKELAEAEAIKIELAQTRSELAVELEQLKTAKDVATNEAEIIAIDEREKEIKDTEQKAAEIERDITINVQTSGQAAQNLNREIVAVQAQAESEGISPKKPGNITPILLTIAAGLLLS